MRNVAWLWPISCAALCACDGCAGCRDENVNGIGRDTGAVCGLGTVEQDGECRCMPAGEAVQCGAGTVKVDGGTCVVAEDVCDSGTELRGGRCVVTSEVCAVGTTFAGGRCIADCPDAATFCGGGTHLLDDECKPDIEECGEDARLDGTACVGVLGCGDLTVRSGDVCVPVCPPVVSCATGTRMDNHTCQPEIARCGSGTRLVSSECVADVTACGRDAMFDGQRCVSVMTCGNGTHRFENICRPDIENCGTATQREGATCNAMITSCGTGTTQNGAECVVAEQCIGEEFCGDGTEYLDNRCECDYGVVVGSDDTWKVNNRDVAGWTSLAFDDTAWVNALQDMCGDFLNQPCGPVTDFMPGTAAHWTWYPDPWADFAYFRKVFTLNRQPVSAILRVYFDDEGDVYLNDVRVVNETSDSAGPLVEAVVTANLVQGQNVIAVMAHDTSSANSMLLELVVRY